MIMTEGYLRGQIVWILPQQTRKKSRASFFFFYITPWLQFWPDAVWTENSSDKSYSEPLFNIKLMLLPTDFPFLVLLITLECISTALRRTIFCSKTLKQVVYVWTVFE